MSSCLRQSSLLAVTFWDLSAASDQRLAAASSAFTGATVRVQVIRIVSCKEPTRSESLLLSSHKINLLIENTADTKLIQMIKYVWCCLEELEDQVSQEKLKPKVLVQASSHPGFVLVGSLFLSHYISTIVRPLPSPSPHFFKIYLRVFASTYLCMGKTVDYLYTSCKVSALCLVIFTVKLFGPLVG